MPTSVSPARTIYRTGVAVTVAVGGGRVTGVCDSDSTLASGPGVNVANVRFNSGVGAGIVAAGEAGTESLRSWQLLPIRTNNIRIRSVADCRIVDKMAV